MRAADGGGAGAAIDPARLFARWSGEGALALAVSGGADSLALMLLAARWRDGGAAPRLIVLSLDHGLRPEAAAEVAMVGRVAASLGLPFRALAADTSLPPSDIEAAARALRYRLLGAAAREAGASVLMTAHHADDQAETVMLRLARGSGIYGLAAMEPETERDGLRIARPLLVLRHADLAAMVSRAGLEPVADPHNEDGRFARARMRALMPRLAAEGLDTPRLVATAARFRSAALAIDAYVERLFATAAVIDEAGGVRLDVAAALAEPEETLLRAVSRILRAVGGSTYPPRLSGIGALVAAMANDGEPLKRTVAGVVVDRRKGLFRFQREAGRDGLPEMAVAGGFDAVWDGRFAVTIAGAPPGARLGALGVDGRRAVRGCIVDALPLALAATPALIGPEGIIAAPLAGVAPPDGISFTTRSIVKDRLLDRSRSDDL
ncbi:tRNA lysidine(34) synthetase TilS [Kaistia geumhonensis]|uniref:tRNA(Ile)-lysidine synthase n=1 Tax=Kaistia geumhonensis TaxID=410839 RepID=A0ABU0MAJ0_9HYPH|nr:tRNA lysidine(34) synthetase TilS [Kaistia geumhonensis]MCX5480928.1 tRNA lysidine(34) synthetase TilS [Kaistia geumhonensis]MDQ0517985.1 tRNA(Ile)-lysidine synthase [Kaistia geumhonensis]